LDYENTRFQGIAFPFNGKRFTNETPLFLKKEQRAERRLRTVSSLAQRGAKLPTGMIARPNRLGSSEEIGQAAFA